MNVKACKGEAPSTTVILFRRHENADRHNTEENGETDRRALCSTSSRLYPARVTGALVRRQTKAVCADGMDDCANGVLPRS